MRRLLGFGVGAGPHRACRIMQYFGGDGPRQVSPERAESVRWHHDQINLMGAGEGGNLKRGIAAVNESVHPEAAELVDKTVIESPLNRLNPFARTFAC